MGEFMSLLGIFAGMAGIVGAAVWLIAMVTGGAGGGMTPDGLEERQEQPDKLRRLGAGRPEVR